MIFISKCTSRCDLSHCILRISRFQRKHNKNNENIVSAFRGKSKFCWRKCIKNPVFFQDVSIKSWWNFVRLGWFIDQNLGLGVIYRTVSSESQDSSIILWKIIKISSVFSIKSQNVVDVFFHNFMFVLMMFRSNVRVKTNGAREKS